jgi:hypothetical protein
LEAKKVNKNSCDGHLAFSLKIYEIKKRWIFSKNGYINCLNLVGFFGINL